MLFDVAVIRPPFYGANWLLEFGNLDPDLLVVAFFTILIEVPLFGLCGYRKWKQLLYFAGVNLVSNLLLNEFLELTDSELEEFQLIVLGEIFVVLLEFCLCCYFVETDRKKLLKTLIFTNAVSFLIGYWYYYIYY